MAFLGLRLQTYTFSGVVDQTFAVHTKPGVIIAGIGCRVEVAATAGTMVITYDGATLMADAQILPQAAGIKRSATTAFVLGTHATANTLLADTTGITGVPVIHFYFLMARVEPGVGEP